MIAIARTYDAGIEAHGSPVKHRVEGQARGPRQAVAKWEARALSAWLVLTAGATVAILALA
ncbi:MAG TPA: hypothetical protein VHV55_22450 [Pirellulales bacterium]|jgi:hypothetical protein|nr:hypothetical protein [Pirellulales bacterium]